MNKETIRPLLVEALEKARALEERAYKAAQEGSPERDWMKLADVVAGWQAAKLRRVEVELHLWLADRQWEREEAENLEPSEVRLNASLTTKP